MSKQKGPVYGTPETIPCSTCGATIPWHFKHCIWAGDRHCLECEAIWPRHYPGCKRDVLKFGYWWIPLSAQKDLIALFKAEKTAYENIHGRIQLPPPPALPEETNEVEPFLDRALALRLLQKVRAAAEAPDKYTHDKLKYEIIDAVDQATKKHQMFAGEH